MQYTNGRLEVLTYREVRAFIYLRGRTVPGDFCGPDPDIHLHARPEPVDDRHQAIGSKPRKVRIANTGEVGRRDPCTSLRGAHAETFPIERLDDFCCENGLKLFDIRTLVPEVTESISTSAHHLQLFALHRNISQIVNPWSRIPNP